jgi:hypothetical protein
MLCDFLDESQWTEVRLAGFLRSEFFICHSVYLTAYLRVFTPVKCIICDPLDESQWTEVRLAGLEFASTLLRQPWRSYLKLTFF